MTDSAHAAQAPTPAATRIAGAPISWGVCEVPNWGYQLSPQQVLAALRTVRPFIELPDLVVQDPGKISGAGVTLINVGARAGVLGKKDAGEEPKEKLE